MDSSMEDEACTLAIEKMLKIVWISLHGSA